MTSFMAYENIKHGRFLCSIVQTYYTVIQQPDTSGKKSELHQQERDTEMITQNF